MLQLDSSAKSRCESTPSQLHSQALPPVPAHVQGDIQDPRDRRVLPRRKRLWEARRSPSRVDRDRLGLWGCCRGGRDRRSSGCRSLRGTRSARGLGEAGASRRTGARTGAFSFGFGVELPEAEGELVDEFEGCWSFAILFRRICGEGMTRPFSWRVLLRSDCCEDLPCPDLKEESLLADLDSFSAGRASERGESFVSPSQERFSSAAGHSSLSLWPQPQKQFSSRKDGSFIATVSPALPPCSKSRPRR